MRVISLTGATSVTDPDASVEYVPEADGVFNLPEPFGLQLTTKHASIWQGEAAHQAAQRSALIEELRNPTVLSTVVADLRDQVAKLTAQVADHEVKLTSKAAQGSKSAAMDTVAPEPTPAATQQEPEPSDESQEAEQGDGTGVQDSPAQDETAEASESDGESSTDAKPERARKTVAKKAAAPKPTG